ncbi:MAG: carboxypeptidase-like regulatory domain-containing protein [Planctomycetaceae bacterium]|jgi:hypothetical protein|nr:carboxypeptidase-like regulatory domain-containing protein [Planctomycetaceae bacterium]
MTITKFNQIFFCTIILNASILGVAVLLLSGCQKNPFGTIPVTGTVKVDGKPAEGVNVTLIPISTSNLGAYGLTIADGSFVTTTAGAKFGCGAQPGEYNVTFSKTDVEEKYKSNTFRDPNDKTPLKDYVVPPLIYIIPERYGDIKTSGITPIKVEKGKKNHFNFDLSTKK